MTFKDPVKAPLFLPSDDNELSEDYAEVPDDSVPFEPCNNDDDDFVLDDSIFDIQPSPFADEDDKATEDEGVPLESQPTKATMKPWLRSPSLLSSAPPTRRPALKETSTAVPDRKTQEPAVPIKVPEPTQADPFADDLAELEAWLHSSAVELVDHVD